MAEGEIKTELEVVNGFNVVQRLNGLQVGEAVILKNVPVVDGQRIYLYDRAEEAHGQEKKVAVSTTALFVSDSGDVSGVNTSLRMKVFGGQVSLLDSEAPVIVYNPNSKFVTQIEESGGNSGDDKNTFNVTMRAVPK